MFITEWMWNLDGQIEEIPFVFKYFGVQYIYKFKTIPIVSIVPFDSLITRSLPENSLER